LDSQLVSGSLSANEGSGRESPLPFLTYTEQFNEQFPYYLAIGMTPEQYWEGDPTLAKYYRKAEEIRVEKRNQEMWLQGMYIYEAICDASPILHAFAKRGTKPHPYTEKPYVINDTQRKREDKSKEKAVFDKGKKMMEAFMKATNNKFKEKEQE
jgi:hypothetical protein